MFFSYPKLAGGFVYRSINVWIYVARKGVLFDKWRNFNKKWVVKSLAALYCCTGAKLSVVCRLYLFVRSRIPSLSYNIFIKKLPTQLLILPIYEGKSISKLQIVTENRWMRIMTYKQHLFSNVISKQIKTIVPPFHKSLETCAVKFLWLLSEPLAHCSFNHVIVRKAFPWKMLF